MAKFQLRSDQRAAFVGKTGSGKTYAARHFLSNMRRLLVFDPKGTLTKSKGWELDPWSDSGVKKLRDGDDIRIRVPSPDDNNWRPYLEVFFKCRDALLYIDEMYAIADDKNSKDIIRAIYTRGRELGLGLWAATQRPKQVPRYMFTEAEWYLVWRLQDKDDRKRIVEATGLPDLGEIPKGKYHFWLANAEWNNALNTVVREK